MITISKSVWWMSNTISHEEIAAVASSAYESVARENGGIEQVEDPRTMSTGEKIVDYFFCGNVKKEYMDYLYQMSRSRALLDAGNGKLRRALLLMRTESDTESGKFVQPVSKFEMKQRLEIYNTNLRKINSLMPEKTIEFDNETTDCFNGKNNYLITRDKTQIAIDGIPLDTPSSSRMSLPCVSVSLVPRFKSIDSIQVKDLATIQSCEELGVDDHIYFVKFAKRNEPVVMRIGDVRGVDSIQKKLHNLWSINNVKDKFIQIMNRCPNEIASDHLNFTEDSRLSSLKLPAHMNPAHLSRVNTAIQKWTTWMNTESDVIFKEIDRFEKLASPTKTDAHAFVLLQNRINSIGIRQNKINDDLQIIQKQL